MRPYPTDPNDVEDQMRWWIEVREEGQELDRRINKVCVWKPTRREMVIFMILLALIQLAALLDRFMGWG